MIGQSTTLALAAAVTLALGTAPGRVGYGGRRTLYTFHKGRRGKYRPHNGAKECAKRAGLVTPRVGRDLNSGEYVIRQADGFGRAREFRVPGLPDVARILRALGYRQKVAA